MRLPLRLQEVGAADCRSRQANNRIRRLFDLGLRNVLKTNIADLMKDNGFHMCSSFTEATILFRIQDPTYVKESRDWERNQYCREEALEGTARSDTSRSDEQQDNHTQCDEHQDLRAERDNRMHGAYTHPAIPLRRLGQYGHIF